MDWGEVLTDVLVVAIEVFVPVAIALLLAWLRPLFKKWDAQIGAQMGEAQWEFTKKLILRFVQAAEQRGLWDDLLKEGTAKKEWVKSQLFIALAKYDLTIDWNEVDSAIEDAVFGMNLDSTAVNNGGARLSR
jgi:hypothetical protein